MRHPGARRCPQPLLRPFLYGRYVVHPLRRGGGFYPAVGGDLPQAAVAGGWAIFWLLGDDRLPWLRRRRPLLYLEERHSGLVFRQGGSLAWLLQVRKPFWLTTPQIRRSLPFWPGSARRSSTRSGTATNSPSPLRQMTSVRRPGSFKPQATTSSKT